MQTEAVPPLGPCPAPHHSCEAPEPWKPHLPRIPTTRARRRASQPHPHA